ncbi:MAG: GNAT family N-acetyltransferase [Pseudomonadota bacterium]
MTRLIPAGTEVPYTITYLEMGARPTYDRPSLPLGPPTALIAAEAPPVWYFMDLYHAVGREHEWVDWDDAPAEEVAAFVQSPRVQLYTLMRSGWPAGFFMLDWREDTRCDLAYFGLVPQAIGLGLGSYLLKTAIHAGWDLTGVNRMTVQTCTLDHPAALGLYQKCGFVPYAQEEKRRVLTRDRTIRESS